MLKAATPMGAEEEAMLKALAHKQEAAPAPATAGSWATEGITGAASAAVERYWASLKSQARAAGEYTTSKAHAAGEYTTLKARAAGEYTTSKALAAGEYTASKARAAGEYTTTKARAAGEYTTLKALAAGEYTTSKARAAGEYTTLRTRQGVALFGEPNIGPIKTIVDRC
ncbi:hypothetical protein CFC21_059133 [Triticum aestivum]|uniref:Mucin-like domain-containing protein n=3 Tax=Triticum aestivum TaxID=4565 RepID=A0A3B6IUI6_WHEAT|nr:hypothetical protein CFC21_059133 [Triticum aestivum]